ncbi:ABC transporter substrate-binding protein [Anthocerotibacter panamensis]|uniref:ABC transporter substrate-binding protein n=1 Tax=Anthocerotibacter panamensis TaxID=2857077 RepID=UPI001C4060BF|nr:ABC transporter substrate-binding protein [Anthocerotibacter panamensis]
MQRVKYLKWVLALALFWAAGVVQAEPLVMGTSLWVGYSPFYIAQAKGYFKDEGLDLKERFFSVGSDGNVALGAGRVDGLLAVASDTLVLAERGKKLKFVIVADYSDGADGIVARGASSVRDLKGKRVSVEFGTVWQYLLLRALDLNGLTEKDIRLTNASGDAGTAAFIGGKLDALAIGEPALSRATQDGKAKIIFDSRQLPGELIDGVTFDAQVVARRPEDIKKFMRAWFRGVDFLYSNPKEASAIVGKTLRVPAQQVLTLLKVDRVLTLTENKEAFFNPKSPLSVLKNTRLNAQFLQKRRLLKTIPDLGALLDNPLLKSF